MKTVICNLWKGENLPAFSENAYGPQDVVRLWKGARRHLTGPLRFVVFCDEHYFELLAAPEAALMVERAGLDWAESRLVRYAGHGIGGWTNVMESMNPQSFIDGTFVGSRVLLVGLDTVFVGDSNWLFDWNAAPIGLPRDPYSGYQPCDAVVTFDYEGARAAWGEYLRAKQKHPFPHMLGGKPSEMVLLQHLWKMDGDWPYLEPEAKRLLSFKGAKLHDVDRVPNGTSIVYFHGRPKLWDLEPTHPVRVEWERV